METTTPIEIGRFHVAARTREALTRSSQARTRTLTRRDELGRSTEEEVL